MVQAVREGRMQGERDHKGEVEEQEEQEEQEQEQEEEEEEKEKEGEEIKKNTN